MRCGLGGLEAPLRCFERSHRAGPLHCAHVTRARPVGRPLLLYFAPCNGPTRRSGTLRRRVGGKGRTRTAASLTRTSTRHQPMIPSMGSPPSRTAAIALSSLRGIASKVSPANGHRAGAAGHASGQSGRRRGSGRVRAARGRHRHYALPALRQRPMDDDDWLSSATAVQPQRRRRAYWQRRQRR